MLDDTLWPATSALIDEACGVVGNALFIVERPQPQGDVRVTFAGLHYRGERRADLEREYMSIYHPIDERVPRIRQVPDSRIVHTTDLYTTEELKISPVYNDGLRRGSMQDSVNVRLVEPDASSVTWSIGDPVTPGGWGAAQLSMIQALLPHIRQFVRVRQALAEAEARGRSSPPLLDNTRVGVICLDQRGRIVEANDRARSILRRGDEVVDRNGSLWVRLPTDRVRWERLVAGALPTSGSPAVSGSMTLRRSNLLAPFVVHVIPVEVRQPDYGAQRVAALVLLVESGQQHRIDSSLVAETLGLTPVESQIAVWLAQGRTVRDIVEVTERTENTVYWHLKRIYHKLSLSGQADLVRLVLSVTEFR